MRTRLWVGEVPQEPVYPGAGAHAMMVNEAMTLTGGHGRRDGCSAGERRRGAVRTSDGDAATQPASPTVHWI